MPKKYKFNAILIEIRRGGVGIEVPIIIQEKFGTRGQVKVKAKFNGYEYRGSIAPIDGRHVLGVRKDIREAIDKSIGDIIEVEFEQDIEPRVVVVPDDFYKALMKNKKAKKNFDDFAFTHRKEYVRWIDEAKKTETRKSRIIKAVNMISNNKKFS